MKGIELAEQFYLQFGKDMIEQNFSEYKDRIAVGICGEGSECLGYDDKLSCDHDFEPCFCMFVTKEDYEKIGFKLEREYAKLPREFMGYKRQILSAVGGQRHGVICIEDFLLKHLGSPSLPSQEKEWFFIPPNSLLNATNGKIFKDGLGIISEIRNTLKKGYPLNVKKKKISAHLIRMAQAGQYNYARCIERGETGASQLAVFEFVNNAISVIYLLNDRYEPYYKWCYRGLRDLPELSHLELSLTGLTELGNSPKEASEKMEIIEDISAIIIERLKKENLTDATCNNLQIHAYSVQDKITDLDIRQMNIFDGI